MLWGLAALVMLPLLLLGGGLLIFLQGVASNNASRLEALPANQARFEAFIDGVEAETAWRVLVTSGYRSPAQQKEEAKTNPDATKGCSRHSHGLAIDINLFQLSWRSLMNRSLWRVKKSSTKRWLETGVVAVAKRHGLKWGGYFSRPDRVHFFINEPCGPVRSRPAR